MELILRSDSYLCCWKYKSSVILRSKLQGFQLHGNMTNLFCQRVCIHQCIQSAELGVSLGGSAGTSPPSLAHAFLCVCYNKAFVQGGQIGVHVSCPLVFFAWSSCHHPPPFSPERKLGKAIIQCFCEESALPPFSFWNVNRVIAFLCASTGVGCFFPVFL